MSIQNPGLVTRANAKRVGLDNRSSAARVCGQTDKTDLCERNVPPSRVVHGGPLMSRINTNVQSLIAQRVLGMNNQSLSKSLERLSTGLKINRGKDDPAGLIASEALRSEMKAINAAIDNSERADQVVNIAEGGLGEISNLLTELQGLVTTSANCCCQVLVCSELCIIMWFWGIIANLFFSHPKFGVIRLRIIQNG